MKAHLDGNESNPVFGEALAFYTIAISPSATELLVVYHPVVGLHQVLRRWQGAWSDAILAARVSSIHMIIGIWKGTRTEQIHILRKHPGLALLSDAERAHEELPGDAAGNDEFD